MSSKKVYLIKNLSPWMMDELLAFSGLTSFRLVLLREPGAAYSGQLTQLAENGIEIIRKPFGGFPGLRNLIYAAGFILRNFFKLLSGYSAVVGWKSIYWFLKLDRKHFPPGASIHAQFATQPALIAMMLKQSGKNGTEYFFTFHAYDIYFANRWFSALVNHATKAFSISAYNIKYVAEKFSRLNRSNLALARLGAFPPDNSFTGAPAEGFRIGFLGRFVEKKGVIYLLQAMEVLQQQGSSVQLILAGGGPLLETYQDFIKQAGLNNVSLPGSVFGNGKDEFFRDLHAFVMPSVRLEDDMDGIPVVLMEAVSYGLPLVATDISGLGEICIQDHNGLLIPERDVDALVKAIGLIATSKQHYERFRKQAGEVFREYDIRVNSRSKLISMNWL